MATKALSVAEHAVAPSSPLPLIGLIAALALAVLSLLPRLTLFRLPLPTGDPPVPQGILRGVRLLI